MAVLASITVPLSLAGLDRARGWASARFVAARLVKARAEAVGRGAAVAVRIDGDAEAATVSAFADGNHTGVLTRDIEAGVDARIDGPVTLSSLFPGVGVTDDGAVRLFSFSPDGTATPGSIYLVSQDGSRFAVRVLGTTARVRIERFIAARNEWVEGF